jgi:putative membrane protein
MGTVSILTNWILSALALVIVANYVPGFHVNSFTTALIVALVLGIVNSLIKPFIIILTLPINILTLGLFTFVINAFLLLAVARFVAGFTINGFVPALIGAVILWLINIIIHMVVFPVKAV